MAPLSLQNIRIELAVSFDCQKLVQHVSTCSHLDNEPREVELKMATTEDSMKKVQELVIADRRLNVCEIAVTVGISKDHIKYWTTVMPIHNSVYRC